MSKLYTYDPGGTTGWAEFEVTQDTKAATLVDSGEFDLWRGIEKQLDKELDRAPWAPDIHVAYENIIPRHMDFNPVGLQTIGVIRFLCEKRFITHTSQPNNLIHGVERWGIYDLSRIKSPHARDAIMHGIVYLRKLSFAVTV